ncbi:NAD(P)-binding domain-containing protein, partial [Francisella tularensis subsp. holarctica]|uniref:pyrroline-5-carboxylate reductase family protein n=1 Tax=Francisella tularensis TaxID=263 RepID=UPI002381ADF9
DRNEHKCLNLIKNYNINTSKSLLNTIKLADILILAIKTQNMFELIKNIRDTVTSTQVIVTEAAGIHTSAYEELFNKEISFA